MDERQEFRWVDDFFEEYNLVLNTCEMRKLLEQDLQCLAFQYELMDLRENIKKGDCSGVKTP